MRVSKVLAIAGAATLVLAASRASAHHSFAMFDNLQSTTLLGTVREFQWTNPHCYVQLMVKDPATGKEVEWSLELSSPGALTRGGWKRTSIKAGDQAEVVIHPLKDGRTGGSLITAKINGHDVGLKDPENPQP